MIGMSMPAAMQRSRVCNASAGVAKKTAFKGVSHRRESVAAWCVMCWRCGGLLTAAAHDGMESARGGDSLGVPRIGFVGFEVLFGAVKLLEIGWIQSGFGL